jgi:hypothetical protein
MPDGAAVMIGSAAADPFLGQGWHPGRGAGRWTGSRTAEMFFRAPSNREQGFLELSGRPFRLPEAVSFALNDREMITHRFEQGDAVVRLPVSFPGPFRLTITVSPLALGLSDDGKMLGFWLSSVRFVSDGAADEQPGKRQG